MKPLCQPAQQRADVQQYHTKLAQKFCKTIFMLLGIYYKILETYSQDNWMDVLDTSFTYLISINLNSLVPERNKSISPLPTPVSTLYTWPLAQYFKNLRSSLPNFLPWMASLRAPKRWKSVAAKSGLYGGWTGTVCLSFVTASYASRLVCSHVLSC